jgi:hypothetical protein
MEAMAARRRDPMRAAVVYVRIVAIVFLVFGVIAAAVPDGYIVLLGADASVGGRLWGRAFGAVAVAFGAVLWELPRKGPSGVRLAARAAVVAFGLTGLVDLLSVLQSDLPTIGWGFVAFNAAMAGLGASYAATAGRAASPSAPPPERTSLDG